MESWVQSWRPRANAFFRFFHSTRLKYCACHEKLIAKSNEVLHLSRKIISANLKIWCSKMEPLSGNQRPDLRTALMNMFLALRLPRERHLARSSSNDPRLPSFLEMLQSPHVDFWQRAQSFAPATQNDIWNVQKCSEPFSFLHFWLQLCFAPQRRALFRHHNSQLPKVVRAWCVLCILTSKCASPHTGAHFFDSVTSKSDLKLRCFVHFGFETCFAPQWRALFSTSQLPKVVRCWCVLYVLTWKSASRHNGVQLFISHLTTWLRTRRFSEPTFRPSGAINHHKSLEKHSEPRLFYLFARLHLLSSDSFSFLLFFLLLFSSLTLPTSAFSSVHVVGSLTSKLPSIIWILYIYIYILLPNVP